MSNKSRCLVVEKNQSNIQDQWFWNTVLLTLAKPAAGT